MSLWSSLWPGHDLTNLIEATERRMGDVWRREGQRKGNDVMFPPLATYSSHRHSHSLSLNVSLLDSLFVMACFYAWFLTVISNIGMDVCLEEGRLEANNIRLLTTRYYSLPLTHIPLLLSLPFILFPLESSLVSSLLKPYWATLQWVDVTCEREMKRKEGT